VSLNPKRRFSLLFFFSFVGLAEFLCYLRLGFDFRFFLDFVNTFTSFEEREFFFS
jgi:hypothetical protein